MTGDLSIPGKSLADKNFSGWSPGIGLWMYILKKLQTFRTQRIRVYQQVFSGEIIVLKTVQNQIPATRVLP